MYGWVCADAPFRTPFIPAVRPFPSPLGEGARSADEGENSCWHRGLPLTLALSRGRGKMRSGEKSRKLILTPFDPWETALGFRDGRHELSHLCPGTCGACPHIGDDIPKFRQGVRPGRGALNDRPHLPDALESGWRQPGKTPCAGCLLKRPYENQRFIGLGRYPAPSSCPNRQAPRRGAVSACRGAGGAPILSA